MIKKIVVVLLFIVLAAAVITVKASQKKNAPVLPAETGNDTGILDNGTLSE